MATIKEIRQQYPQYRDLTDSQLADALRDKFYPDIPKPEFYRRAEVGGKTTTGLDIAGSLIGAGASLAEFGGGLYGLATGDMKNAATDFGQQLRQSVAEPVRSEAIRARERAIAQSAEEAEKRGGFLAGAGTSIAETIKDPEVLASALAGQLPMMVGPGLLGVGGKIAGAALLRGAGAAAAKKAAQRGAALGVGVGSGALVAGDAGNAVYERVMKTPQDALEKSNVYQSFVGEGMSPDEARQATALRQARIAAVPAGVVGGLTAGLGGIETGLLTGAFNRGLVRGAVKGALKEGGQETIDEGQQAIAENLAVGEIDPTVKPLEGVGARVGSGLVLGGTMGGIAGGASGFANRGAVEPALPEGDGTFAVINGKRVKIEPQPPAPTAATEGEIIDVTPNAPVEPLPVQTEGATVPAAPAATPAAVEPVTVAPVTPTEGPVAPTQAVTPSTTTLNVNGNTFEVTAIPDSEGNVTVDSGGGQVDVFPQAEWEGYVRKYGVVPAVAPEPTPTVAPTVAPEPTPAAPTVAPEPTPTAVAPEPESPTAPTAAPTRQPRVTPVTQESFDAANKPTQAFEKAMIGKTIPQAADWLAKNAKLAPIRSIMSRVAGVVKAMEALGVKTEMGVSGQKIPNVASKLIEGEKSARGAFASTVGGRMLAGLASMRRADPGVQEVTAAHELIHAATRMSLLGANSLPPNSRVRVAVGELKNLHKEVRAHWKSLTAEQKAAINATNENNIDYRISSADELIAYGLTEYNFQQFLKTVPTKRGNAFTDFVKSIGKLLGVAPSDQNALARLIELSEDLIPVEASEVDAVAQSAAKQLGVVRSDTVLGDEANPDRPSLRTALTGATEPEPLALPTETWLQRHRRNWLDRLERLRVVENLGQLINRSKSAYEAGRRFDARAAARLERFQREYFSPILEGMRKEGISLSEMDWYLWARSAKARNFRIMWEDIQKNIIAPMEAKSGLKFGSSASDPNPDAVNFDAEVAAEIQRASENGELKESGSGMSNEDADALLAEYAAKPNSKAYEGLAEKFTQMNRERMELAVQSGLVSRETANALNAAEPEYAPLKGRSKDDDITSNANEDDHLIGYGGSGFSVSKNEWYKARGRTSPPFSPLSTAISDAQMSIVRGERNVVGQLVMEFMINNPSTGWRVFSFANPPRDKNGNKISVSDRPDRYSIVKKEGKTFYIEHKDPTLARAINALDKKELVPIMNSWALRTAGLLVSALGRSFTSANPFFPLVNFPRDVGASVLNLLAETDKGGRVDGQAVIKNFLTNLSDGAAWKAIIDAENKIPRKFADPEMAALYEQFKMDGGTTGWIQRNDAEDVANRIKRDFDRLALAQQEWTIPTNKKEAQATLKKTLDPIALTGRALVNHIENANSTFEASVRFAAYRAGLQAGLSREEAAMLARESTVDFNRKGEAVTLLNTLYMFLNAGIQGTARTGRALKSRKVQAAILSSMGTVAMLAAYNAAVSGEDDDGELFWDKIPSYEKDRNIILMNPIDGKIGFKIPVPYGYGFFPAFATRMADSARLGDDAIDVATRTFSSALNNFSPVQFQSENVPTSILKASVPTLLKPVFDVLSNTNFMDKPIYQEPFDKAQSLASVSRYNTPAEYKAWAQWLNDISGGEGKKAGAFNTSPEAWQYLLEFGLGGIGQTVGSAWRAGSEGNIAGLPLINKVISSPSPSRNVGAYYENAFKVQENLLELRNKETPEDAADYRRRNPVETSPAVESALKATRKELREVNALRKRIEASAAPDDVKEQRLRAARERIERSVIRFNSVYNRVKKEARE